MAPNRFDSVSNLTAFDHNCYSYFHNYCCQSCFHNSVHYNFDCCCFQNHSSILQVHLSYKRKSFILDGWTLEQNFEALILKMSEVIV